MFLKEERIVVANPDLSGEAIFLVKQKKDCFVITLKAGILAMTIWMIF
ncbi:MAG: hypothetical protein KGZ58_12650 [Ignavibacteriales bacterium]|nr:hypothetical protein [Ignavibacteriales bacterium]